MQYVSHSLSVLCSPSSVLVFVLARACVRSEAFWAREGARDVDLCVRKSPVCCIRLTYPYSPLPLIAVSSKPRDVTFLQILLPPALHKSLRR